MSDVHLTVRGYREREVVFTEPLTLSETELDTLLPELAEKHCTAMADGQLNMVEIEFMDEEDINQRFFRLGTSPDGMVMPLRINLGAPV